MWSFVSTWSFSRQAADAGAEILKNGGDAMDAVIAGIHHVESDSEVESVGKGGFLNEKGELALDAAVMAAVAEPKPVVDKDDGKKFMDEVIGYDR